MDDEGELSEGSVIAGRYRIARRIGAGGMGAVYEATQEGLGRRVAVKVLHGDSARSAEVVTRFQREARAAASIGHPNIVAVTDFGCDAGRVFLVMERLAGRSLGGLLSSEGPLDPGRAAWIASQTLDALGAAHRAGIVHRDIKPDNVFLTEVSGVGDLVKVLDFGIARFGDGGVDGELSHDPTLVKLTRTGAVLGTPAYMSPEQARGRAVDARTDLYAVGVLLYEMLTGALPFRATNYNALLFAILEDTPPPIATARPDVPPALIAAVERAMAKDASDRFQSAREMREALAPWAPRVSASGPEPTARPSPVDTAAIAPTLADATGASPARTTAPVAADLASAPTGGARARAPRGFGAFVIVGVVSALGIARLRPLPRQRHEGGSANGQALATGSAPASGRRPAPERGDSSMEVASAGAAEDPRFGVVTLAPDPAVADGAAMVFAGRAGSDAGARRVSTVRSSRPAIETVLNGGIFAGTNRAAVARQVEPLLPRLSRCAEEAPMDPDARRSGGSPLDLQFTLDPGTGRVLHAQPRGSVSIERAPAVQCALRVFDGAELVVGGRVATLRLWFFQRARPR